ncbi:hypothetical protein [Spongorhabdus nitratireducens]
MKNNTCPAPEYSAAIMLALTSLLVAHLFISLIFDFLDFPHAASLWNSDKGLYIKGVIITPVITFLLSMRMIKQSPSHRVSSFVLAGIYAAFLSVLLTVSIHSLGYESLESLSEATSRNNLILFTLVVTLPFGIIASIISIPFSFIVGIIHKSYIKPQY